VTSERRYGPDGNRAQDERHDEHTVAATPNDAGLVVMVITIIWAIAAAIAAVTGLCGALYVWFRVSLSRYDGVTAIDP